MATVAEKLARKVDALRRSSERGDMAWVARHREAIEKVEIEYLPRGSGIDMGITLLETESTGEKLTFHIPYHHMDIWGGYMGWQIYRATVSASLLFGISIDIEVSDTLEYLEEWETETTKEYLAETLSDALQQEVGE